MCSVRIPDRLLALMSEQGEDGGALRDSCLPADCVADSFLAKAADRVVFEVSSGRFVLGVLIAANAANNRFALESCAGEEMAQAAIVILNRYVVGLEETIDWRTPSLLKIVCEE
jgi:hypothetical protein